MKREDVIIGMKVIPHKKSVGCSLNFSNAYIEMKASKQEFLYVAHQHADEVGKSDRFLLSNDETNMYLCGDYFLCSDFEEYK